LHHLSDGDFARRDGGDDCSLRDILRDGGEGCRENASDQDRFEVWFSLNGSFD
jgi:hypothetical protein